MIRRSMVWRIVAVLFTLVNLGGAVIAAVAGEGLHTALHVVLLLAGAYWVWRVFGGAGSRAPSEEATQAVVDARLEQLQHSVDAVAIEVERIGEAQRFNTKLQQERARTSQ